MCDLKHRRGGRRYAPYAFTEQGVAMLSSVLNSPQAIAVNIKIMCACERLLASNNEPLKKDIESTETGRYASTADRTLMPVAQNQTSDYR